MVDRRRFLRTAATGAVAFGVSGCLDRITGSEAPDVELLGVDYEDDQYRFENDGGPGTVHFFAWHYDSDGTLFEREHDQFGIDATDRTIYRTGALDRPDCSASFETGLYTEEELGGDAQPIDASADAWSCPDEEESNDRQLVRCRNVGDSGRVSVSFVSHTRSLDQPTEREFIVPADTELVYWHTQSGEISDVSAEPV